MNVLLMWSFRYQAPRIEGKIGNGTHSSSALCYKADESADESKK
jgi:hypothetical protein